MVTSKIKTILQTVLLTIINTKNKSKISLLTLKTLLKQETVEQTK